MAAQVTDHFPEEGILRTDHMLTLWRIPVLRLHYRIERRRAAI